ncbi:MAG: ribosome assembly RNA-binding protein YhbY [Bacillota bacterium]|nr:ribosome assembly RNA-binding protein YhbY [Bacillota bacterium]
MLTSKQRAYLRALANKLEPVVIIGKGDIDEDVIKQVDDALEARELIKIKVLDTNSSDAKEACRIISRETHSEGVQVIGNKFVLYREREN